MLQTLSYLTFPEEVSVNIHAISEAFSHSCVFDSNPQSNANKYLQRGKIIALGCTRELCLDTTANALHDLEEFLNTNAGWTFGYLSYDLKNDIEQLTSENSDRIHFPEMCFFVPEVVIQINASQITLTYNDEFTSKSKAEELYRLCFNTTEKANNSKPSSFQIKAVITKAEYIDAVNKLQHHILKGDIYEVNYCMEFFAENAHINPALVFEHLNSISQAPFAAYGKFKHHHILCSSPERFIQKTESTLISQPIKGTQKRAYEKRVDEQLKLLLQTNEKEKSENIMIVDLVRNDLSRIARKGSVSVDELLGIYSFKQVHQLMSTIRCELHKKTSFTDIVRSTFPMGSMTGAPKISAMKLIEKYEASKRGVYSGTLGYISPEGDFDFNVIIRSILYNAQKQRLSFMTGSAITAKSNANEEYEECMLKAKAMFEVLQNN